jgi:hypothetical protein
VQVEAAIEAIGDGAEVVLGALALAKGMVGAAETGLEVPSRTVLTQWNIGRSLGLRSPTTVG